MLRRVCYKLWWPLNWEKLNNRRSRRKRRMKGCFRPTWRATTHSENQSCSFLDSTAALGILREVFPKQLCEFSENSLFWSSFTSLLRECWGNSSFWRRFVNSGGILLCLVVWFRIAVEILENGLGVNWKWKSQRKGVLVGGEGQRSNAAKWELEKVLLLAQKTVQETFLPSERYSTVSSPLLNWLLNWTM
jgi:hypothetical protein